MDHEVTRPTNILSGFKVTEHQLNTSHAYITSSLQEYVPPADGGEVVNCSVSEAGNIADPRSSFLSGPSIVATNAVVVPTEPMDVGTESTMGFNSTEWIKKEEDIDDKADLSLFKSMSTENQGELVLQVSKLDSPLIDSKEGLEFGKVKLEDESYKQELECDLGLAPDPSSEARDIPLASGSGLESKSIIVKDHPQKRRRVLLDAVEISTPQWLLPLLDPSGKATQAQREKEFLNPKFKIKRPKEAVEEGLGSVFRRVDALAINPFPLPDHLDRDLLDFTVCREFTSFLYGGNPQQTFPALSKDNQARHPYRDFMYINLIYNPYAPQRPGHPGLFYMTHPSNLPKEHRVLIRIQDGVWLYLGQYELIPAAPLTKEEWAAKSDQTKEKWCTKISRKKWGKDMRARIALRRSLGREPTRQEVAAGDGTGVSADDVRRALDSGVEVMRVLVMKCVGYDEAFQREMRDKRSTWIPPKKTESKKSRKKKRVDEIERETALKTSHEEGVSTMGRTASMHSHVKKMATHEEHMDLESDNESIDSKKSSSENTSTMHGRRQRQNSTTLISDTITLMNETDAPENRPQRIRRMPSRFLHQ